MGRDRELEYIMSLKDEATAAYKKFVGEFEKGSTSIQSLAKGAGVAMAGMFTVAAAAEFIQKAAEADAGVRSLDVALQNAGLAGEQNKKILLEQAEALKLKTAVDDDEIINIQKLVMSYTQNLDATQKLVPAILDVSRATGMSSDMVAKLFSKTQEGSEGLKKLGINIGYTATEEERLAKILENVNQKFGGQAEAFAESDLGKITSAKIAWEDYEKSVGRLLSDVLVPLIPTLTSITNGISDITGNVRTFFAEMHKEGLGKLKNDQESLARTLGTTGEQLRQSNLSYQLMSQHSQTAQIATKELSKDTDAITLSFLSATGQTDAYWQKVMAMAAEHQTAATQTKATIKETKNFQEKLDELDATLKTLDPTSKAYVDTLTKKEKMLNQVALATERAKLASKGLQGTTVGDIKFSGGFAVELQTMKSDASKFFTDFSKESSKMFGGDISPETLKNAQDQADLITELRVKSYGEGKGKELALLNDWQDNAIAMAHGREDLITQITETAAAERAKIEKDYDINRMAQVADLAQQAISLYQQGVSQNSQAAIQQIEKQKSIQLKSIDAERAAIKKKYDDLLTNENLTAEQRATIKAQEEKEENELMARKEAAEAEYNSKIAVEKGKAFNKMKNAQMIASIVNTAVEVTKVLATPWMIPIVAGLGAVQTALIASQPTPSFHTGGAGYFNAPASQEAMVKIRGGERIDVYTPEQRDATNSRGVTLVVNFNAPVRVQSDTEFIVDGIKKAIRETGLTVDQLITDSRNVVRFAQ